MAILGIFRSLKFRPPCNRLAGGGLPLAKFFYFGVAIL